MPPLQKNTFTGVLYESDAETNDGGLSGNYKELMFASKRDKVQLIWRNIIVFTLAHIISFYGIYLGLTSAHWKTLLFTSFLHILGNWGIAAGVHRLWSHRSFKARLPLKIFLMFTSTVAYQNSIYHWAREHRVHHKYSESDADPVNASRGFFFSHVGWLLCKKHSDVKAKGQNVDMSDLKNDPIVWFQHKHYGKLTIISSLLWPLLTPVYFWNESWINSFCIPVILRWVYGLHVVWAINSFAHMFGNRPYDKQIQPTENMGVSIITNGEGYHNYHHVFPWDYRASEWGYKYNLTLIFIDVMAKIGQAYDLKSVSNEMIEKRSKRTGDGTHHIWGWGDPEQDPIERKDANITHRKKNIFKTN